MISLPTLTTVDAWDLLAVDPDVILGTDEVLYNQLGVLRNATEYFRLPVDKIDKAVEISDQMLLLASSNKLLLYNRASHQVDTEFTLPGKITCLSQSLEGGKVHMLCGGSLVTFGLTLENKVIGLNMLTCLKTEGCGFLEVLDGLFCFYDDSGKAWFSRQN